MAVETGPARAGRDSPPSGPPDGSAASVSSTRRPRHAKDHRLAALDDEDHLLLMLVTARNERSGSPQARGRSASRSGRRPCAYVCAAQVPCERADRRFVHDGRSPSPAGDWKPDPEGDLAVRARGGPVPAEAVEVVDRLEHGGSTRRSRAERALGARRRPVRGTQLTFVLDPSRGADVGSRRWGPPELLLRAATKPPGRDAVFFPASCASARTSESRPTSSRSIRRFASTKPRVSAFRDAATRTAAAWVIA